MMDQLFQRYGISIKRESSKKFRNAIVEFKLFDNGEAENCDGRKLLGQRTKIKERSRCDLLLSFKIRIAVTVHMYNFITLPNHYGGTGNTRTLLTVREV